MAVVNVKVEYIRKDGYANLKEWMNDPQNVYIGRAGIVFIEKQRFPKEASVWANPFKVGKEYSREEAIAKYREYIEARLKASPELVKELLALEGKRLGCWCCPEGCHGDVLLECIQRYK